MKVLGVVLQEPHAVGRRAPSPASPAEDRRPHGRGGQDDRVDRSKRAGEHDCFATLDARVFCPRRQLERKRIRPTATRAPRLRRGPRQRRSDASAGVKIFVTRRSRRPEQRASKPATSPKQTSKVGELRSAIADGSMTEADVYAEIGEVCNGSKPGREGKELIVVDLTGTGAQDAAIGQVAWDKLGN